jgi:hypothetical protein
LSAGKDIARLRELAKKVAEIVAGDKNKKRLATYKAINSLSVEPPPVLFQPPDEAVSELFDLAHNCLVEDPFLAKYESQLVQIIRRDEVIGDDLPHLGIIYSGFVHSVTPWMDNIHYNHFRSLANKTSHGSVNSFFDPCIKNLDDIEKMRYPELNYDEKKTMEQYERLAEIFGDTLPVIMGVPFHGSTGWGETLMSDLVGMRGLEQIYYDFVDNPEWIHRVMRFMADGRKRLMDQLFDKQMLCLNNTGRRISSCSPGFTDELPAPGYDPAHIRRCDLWNFSHSQELSLVSPEMLEEFVIPYEVEILDGFGLLCYGCCEPMEHKIDVAERHIKNLRMISINPFTNHEIAAPKCKGKYVYAWKPSSAYMINFVEDENREYLRQNLKQMEGCSVTITLEDTYSYGNDVGRFKRWVAIAHEVINELYN